MLDIKTVSRRCREYRESINRTQADVAEDTGYSVENVSKFERGFNNNLKIYLWYAERGFSL